MGYVFQPVYVPLDVPPLLLCRPTMASRQMCGGVLRYYSGAAFYTNDDTVLARTAEIPGENVGLGGHGRVHDSVGLRGLSGITVWR
jgi:hypothetical protein